MTSLWREYTGVQKHTLLAIHVCSCCLNVLFHLEAKQWIWDNSVYQSTQSLSSPLPLRLIQRTTASVGPSVTNLPVAGYFWEAHGSILLSVYSDLSLTLSRPCSPSRLTSYLLTTLKTSEKTVYMWPDMPNISQICQICQTLLVIHNSVPKCLLGFRWI